MNFNDFKCRFNIILDPQQEEAVQQIKGQSLILAVPGSGKTTVLVARLGYMIYVLGIDPKSILTVTYTVAATNDMRNRFRRIFGNEYANDLEFRTINGISQKILTYYGICTGKKPFDVANKEVGTIIRDCYRIVNDGFATDNDVANIQTAIGYAKNMCLSESAIKRRKVDVDNFYDIYQLYNDTLKKKSLIDYDDQMVYALKILKSIPEMLKYFKDTYKYILVDEAQDTSKIQHQIIRLLAGNDGNLFMVGDEDQSIYGFRAAYPEALMNFQKDYKNAHVHLLETNYRSGKDIVAAAALTISKNTVRHKKNIKAYREDFGKISRLDTKTRRDQYNYLAKKALESEDEIAILYRNNESALPLIDMLDRYGVEFKIKNTDATFFSHPVVNDIRDFIKLAYNPSDDEAFMRIYYKMNVGISKVMAQGAIYNFKNEGILDYISRQDSISTGMRYRIKTLIANFVKLKSEKASSGLNRIINEMGYGKFVENRGLDTGKLDILKILSAKADNLLEFIERVDELQVLMSEGQSSDDCKVILSTIHSAKGLEYEKVYMLDMVDGVLPCCKKPGRYATADEVEAYEEERRLYYVGITRAKNELYIFTYDYDTTSQFSRELFSMQKPKDAIIGTNYAVKSAGPKLSTNYGKARPTSSK